MTVEIQCDIADIVSIEVVADFFVDWATYMGSVSVRKERKGKVIESLSLKNAYSYPCKKKTNATGFDVLLWKSNQLRTCRICPLEFVTYSEDFKILKKGASNR